MTDRTVRRPRHALAVLGLPFLMTILDGTSVLTALPAIEADLGPGRIPAHWTVTAYALAFSGLLLCCGRVADILGRRRMFRTGNALLAGSSLLCAMSPTAEALVAARAFQGVAAAIIAPAALSLLLAVFAEGPERNRALGVWGGLGGIGATTGLLAGGALTKAFGWESVFLVNVPVGALVLVAAPLLLPESRGSARPRTFGAAGAVTLTAAMVALVYAIVELPRAGWLSWHTAGPLVAAVVLGVLFRRLERRSAAPLVPARVVRSRTVRGGNVVILCAGMAVDGMLITLTGYVQGMLGWSPLGFGLATAVMTVTSVAGTLTGQRLATAYGARPVAAAGAALAGLACAMLAWLPGRGSLPLLLCGLFLLGAGLGLAFVCAQIAAVTGVREEDSGFAAGLVDTSFALGTALGIAVCTSVATAAAPGGEPGYRAGFAAAAVFGLLGIAAALVVPRDRRAAPATERASAG